MTHRLTDRPGHREVTLPKIIWACLVSTYISFCTFVPFRNLISRTINEPPFLLLADWQHLRHRDQRHCILENIRQEIYAKIGVRVSVYTDSFEYQFCCSSLATWQSASILRLFRLQSQLLKLAGRQNVYSLLLQYLWSWLKTIEKGATHL